MKELIKVKQTGVWIDSHRAVIISFNGDSKNIETIYSEIETRERVDGETRSNSRFGEQHIDLEKSKESRLNGQRKLFLDDIIVKIKNVDELVFFGPAGMKNELGNQSKLGNKILSIERADSMTENQMAAWVKAYFENR